MSRALRQWIERHAIALSFDAGPSQLAPLDPLLERRRLAFVGENIHWVHEKYPYRLLVARWLHAHGWRLFCEELAWTDGWRIDRYLATGDEAELDRVGTYGYTGARRADRDDEPRGALAGMSEAHPHRAFRAEGRRFNAALRALGNLRFFGFDVDYEPGAGYELVGTLVGDRLLVPGLARVGGETLDEEIARLEQVHRDAEARATALAAELGDEAAAALRRAIRTIWLSHRYVRLIRDAPTYEALRPGMAFRERVMHEHMDCVLGAHPGGKVALFAHNRHLAKDDKAFRGDAPGAGPGGDTEPSIGTYLTRQMPREVFSMWCLEDTGRYIRTLAGDGRIRTVRGSLNAELARAGELLVVPTGADDPASPFHEECEIVSLYGVRYRTAPARQVDAIFFIRQVTPMGEG
jgi:erythromycin esterase-like protein